jgi:predicted esterase
MLLQLHPPPSPNLREEIEVLAEQLAFVHHFRPADRPGPTTTLLLLHGSGGNETTLLPLGQDLAPGAALLSPRGPVVDNQRPRFFRRLDLDVFDEKDLRRRSRELTRFVREAASVYRLRRQRTVVVGYSNGANMAAAMLLLRPRAFRTAVLFRPMVPLLPAALPNLSGLSAFIAGGCRELPVYQEHTERLADLLRRAGAAVILRWEDAEHRIGPQEVPAAREWLADLGL